MTGNISGALPAPALTQQPDGNWTATVTPQREEALSFSLAVDTTPVAFARVNISGLSPFYVDYTASAMAATLTALGNTRTDAVVAGVDLPAYAGETATVEVPVVTKAGTRWAGADPGLKVALALVPPSLVATVNANLQLSLARRRLAAAGAPTAGTEQPDAPAGGSAAPSRQLLQAAPGGSSLLVDLDYSSYDPADLEEGSLPGAPPPGASGGYLLYPSLEPDWGSDVQDKLPLYSGVSAPTGEWCSSAFGLSA